MMPSSQLKMIAVIVAALSAYATSAAEGNDKHMHRFAKDVDALHAVLAPLWHASPGKERSQNTCAQAPKMQSLAQDVRSGDAQPILTALTALLARCQTNPGDIDAAFSGVHDAFHHLAKHKEHTEH